MCSLLLVLVLVRVLCTVRTYRCRYSVQKTYSCTKVFGTQYSVQVVLPYSYCTDWLTSPRIPRNVGCVIKCTRKPYKYCTCIVLPYIPHTSYWTYCRATVRYKYYGTCTVYFLEQARGAYCMHPLILRVYSYGTSTVRLQ